MKNGNPGEPWDKHCHSNLTSADLTGTPITVSDRIWIGDRYAEHRLLILGESYYGQYEGDMETDEVYLREHVAGRQPDKMYEKMEQALGLTAAQLWHQCIFTNLVTGSIGDTYRATAKVDQFKAGLPRLRELLRRHGPARVWIMGKTQSKYSGRVVDEFGARWVACYHPTGKNNMKEGTRATPEHVRATWTALHGR